jgi:dTDP-4-dehydrorhamnose reductase
MIGGGLARAFAERDFDVRITNRSGNPLPDLPDVKVSQFDALTDDLEQFLAQVSEGDYVINCIGLVKARIDDSSRASREKAVALNAEFPSRLAAMAEAKDLRVIQMATDCVYSGNASAHTESAPHDAHDVYGKTKSLGEVPSPAVMNIRVSVIGRGTQGLYHWVASQPGGASIQGYTDHIWNGISSASYGRILVGLVAHSLFKAGVQHIVPADSVNKDALVRLIASHESREDLQISATKSGKAVDRTLATVNPDFNQKLWAAAGYLAIPTIAQLVAEI